MIFIIIFLNIDDLFKTKKTKDLGKAKILQLLLEYLTKLSVRIDIEITSINLDNEYIRGIIEEFLFKNGTDINFDRHSTSLQHRFNPCPPTGCSL